MEHRPLEDLIACCIRGDDDARAEFYVTYAEVIRRAVLRRLAQDAGNRRFMDEAEDVCHEVLEGLFSNGARALKRLHNPKSIDAWLVTVARNHTVTYLRKQSVRARTVHRAAEAATEYTSTPADTAISSETHELVHERLLELSAPEQLVVELYFVQDLTYAEIAAMLNQSINTVAARLRRAKTKLRKMLEEDLR